MDSKATWFVRVPIGKLGESKCPRCKGSYHVGPIFDHHEMKCTHCEATLTEWNLISNIYVIDIEASPKMVKLLIDYLRPLPEPEACNELLRLLRFLGVEK